MMRRIGIILLGCVLGLHIAAAQDLGLIPQNVTVSMQTDVYGQQEAYATGTLANLSKSAYTDVELDATAYGEDGGKIGEGTGYLVNACGEALLPDFSLAPNASQSFAIPLDLDDPTNSVDVVKVTAQGTASDATPTAAPISIFGITPVFQGEIASVEWEDQSKLRFGEGCWRHLFFNLKWREYDTSNTGTPPQPIEHPDTKLVTDALRLQLGLTDPIYFAHSFLSFPPNARRIIYQSDTNTFYTAEPDGSFKRMLFDHLNNRTLQGITWLDNGNFLAYYYGAYGDPVLYFTGTVDGKTYSEPVPNAIPSLIIPGASPDGQQIVIATQGDDGTTSYYVKKAAYPVTTLLFNADAPGNNWPGPLYEQDADGSAFIYVALPVGDTAHLECYNLQSKTLNDLSTLPLQLTTDERAVWSLSPDNGMIALAADGLHGGLWTIALDKLKDCA